MDEFRTLISTEKIDIAIISETWMNTETREFLAEYQISGYDMYESNRKGRKGGGVVIYVKDSITCYRKSDIKVNDNTESVWVEISNSRKKIILGAIYRSPKLSRADSRYLWEEIRKATDNNPSIVVGDFNLPRIDWDNQIGDAESEEFLDVVQDNFLHQYIREPTRGSNILDLVLSNTDNIISDVEIGGQLGNTDHDEIRFKFNWNEHSSENKTSVPNFRLGDFGGLRSFLRSGLATPSGDHRRELGLEINERSQVQVALGQGEVQVAVGQVIDHTSVCDKYSRLVNLIHSGQHRYIPSKTFRANNSDPRWLNNRIKYLIGQRKGIYRKIKRGENQLRNRYSVLNREVKREIRKAKRDYEIKIARESKENPKGFYQMYRTKNKDRIGPLISESGNITSDNKEMCSILNKYFASVFTKENLDVIPQAPAIYNDNNDSILSKITVSQDDVLKEINKLKPHKSPGPDEIYSRVIKETKVELCQPLATIFNDSLSSGLVPVAWKTANVVPIFKKGDKSVASNYRPISLTSIIGKMLESILAGKIRDHLERFKLINESQHGFMQGRSCLTNLLSFFSEVYEAVDCDKEYDIIYLDFSKAFDRVPHERLVRKVQAHGIDGDILQWIKAWLNERKQRVMINGARSNWEVVTSGVPQGSVLGPLLFIMYINDLDSGITSRISKFADDTKIGRVINSNDDCINLQKDLDLLHKWSEDWQMEFNVNKCKVLSVGKTIADAQYLLNNNVISKSDCEKDLGVIVSKDLKPRQQCISARNKANRILGFISRSVSNRTTKVILQLYLALVRPHLDYAVQFWCPYYRMDIDSIEKVQRRMTKMICEVRGLLYENRLKRLNLHSLERRRVRGDLIEVFKWMKGINKGDIGRVLKISMQDRTRTNGFKLDKFRFQKEIGRNWFGNRVVDEWNRLPSDIIAAPSLDSFKHRLDKYMTSKGWI